ncbi:DUF4139 domain-containing protein, partial [Mangrovactinospora gilvigrisea]|uniref:DUF4139 domain-containing protein n=1 Tax=Mangrovactinospora gilvigrisea TaxID=1428644 RepID=UPI000A4C395A
LPAHAVPPRSSAGSFDHAYTCAAPADIAADGAWHSVAVQDIPVEAATEYVTVPAVEEAVYATVRLTNSSRHALLAGPADVSIDGDFLMTVPLATLAPGERRAIGIGVAESIQVVRRAHMEESTAGLRLGGAGGSTVLDHRAEIELANRFPHPVEVRITERVPVSAERDVRIEETEPGWTAPDAPAAEAHFHVRGTRERTVRLEPGRTATVAAGYRIRIPAGKALVGGNRRN